MAGLDLSKTKKLLLVEGKDDEAVCNVLLETMKIEGVLVHDCDGTLKMKILLKGLKAADNIENITHLGVIFDSDGKMKSVEDSVQYHLARLKIQNKGYYIFDPDLEHVFLQTLQGTPQHQCWQQFEVCLEPHLDKINWHSKATALIYHALTFKPEEGAFLHYKSDALRTAIKTDPTLLQSPAFTALKTFLKNTFA